MFMNLIRQVGKIKSDGKKTHSFFFLEKGGRMMWEKNKAVTPRLAFPFCLKIVVKQGNFQEKLNCAFTNQE